MNLGSLNIAKKFRYGDRIQPARDWMILLVLFVIGLAAVTIGSIITFSRVTRGQQVGNAAVQTPAQIQLEQVKELFAERATERARYESEYRFVDPSK